jgi:hypothetical protein
MRSGRLSLAVALTAVLVPAALHADTVFYNGFSNTTGLTLVGNTTTTTTGDGTVLRVVPSNFSQAGAAYYTSGFTLGTSATFSTQFQFRLTNPGGIDPADGITFVLAASPNGLGGAGGGIGYQGVGHSVAIEFDTYNNGGGDNNSDNEVGVDTNGNLNSIIQVNPYGVMTCGFGGGHGCLSNGDVWTALITYDGSVLNVSAVDGAGSPIPLITNYAIDIGSVLGTNTAYVGFTGATGSGYENEDILNWELSDSSTLPPTTVPEPSTLLLMGNGLLGVAYAARKKMQRS